MQAILSTARGMGGEGPPLPSRLESLLRSSGGRSRETVRPTHRKVEYGFAMEAAKAGAWRVYDEDDPEPGYFEFDWLSARFPDLYHRFAISTSLAMDELCRVVDLKGLVVADIGAGTGRSAIAAAKVARKVLAIDAYESVFEFGRKAAEEAGAVNVTYLLADRSSLPIDESSIDAVLAVHAALDPLEAYRVLKADGLLVQLTTAPGALAGELTCVLGPNDTGLTASAEVFRPGYPAKDSHLDVADWNGAPVAGGISIHDFTVVADFGDVAEAAAVLGRFYGPAVARYLHDRRQSSIGWRYRIRYARVASAAE